MSTHCHSLKATSLCDKTDLMRLFYEVAITINLYNVICIWFIGRLNEIVTTRAHVLKNKGPLGSEHNFRRGIYIYKFKIGLYFLNSQSLLNYSMWKDCGHWSTQSHEPPILQNVKQFPVSLWHWWHSHYSHVMGVSGKRHRPSAAQMACGGRWDNRRSISFFPYVSMKLSHFSL